MSPPAYVRPSSVGEAIDLLAGDPWGAKALAGGTALVLMMRQGLLAPSLLVAVDHLDSLSGIRREGREIRIGATTRLQEIASSGLVRDQLPALAEACGQVANIRIRNVATLGGNLGEADYASDPPAVLISLGAWCAVQGPDGERQLEVSDLIEGFYATALEPGELITEVVVPVREGDRRSVYLKYLSRSSEDRPCVGVAAAGTFEDDVPLDLSVVVGAAAPKPQFMPEALERAVRRPLIGETIEAVASEYAERIETLDDMRGSSWYRSRMVEVFVRRALRALLEQGGTGG